MNFFLLCEDLDVDMHTDHLHYSMLLSMRCLLGTEGSVCVDNHCMIPNVVS